MSYALVNIKTLEIVQSFGGDAAPGILVWPNGDQTHACAPGDERGGYRFVSVEYGPAQPGEFHEIIEITPTLEPATLRYHRDWQIRDSDQLRQTLLRRVDEAAETARLKYITAGSGQALTYSMKLEEAKAYTKEADPEAFPLLKASSDKGVTLAETADTVIETSKQWIVMASAIEKVRLDAKRAIAATKTAQEAVAIAEAVQWP